MAFDTFKIVLSTNYNCMANSVVVHTFFYFARISATILKQYKLPLNSGLDADSNLFDYKLHFIITTRGTSVFVERSIFYIWNTHYNAYASDGTQLLNYLVRFV